jgi:hypothetical protein
MKIEAIESNLNSLRCNKKSKDLPILSVPSGVTVKWLLTDPGNNIFESVSFIQKRVGVGLPAAIQSSTAGAPSATFWSVGSTRNIGDAVREKICQI